VTQPSDRTEVAALEQARAGLEVALDANPHWQALRVAADDIEREAHERALADNPLFKSWKVMTEALEDLRARELPQTTAADAVLPALPHEYDSGAPPDDLTRIRGISAALAGRLNELGISRFAQIAAWRAADVRRVSEALDLGKAVSRQNWIEQAALLGRSTPAAAPLAPVAPGPVAHALVAAPSGNPAEILGEPPADPEPLANPEPLPDTDNVEPVQAPAETAPPIATAETAAPWQPQDDVAKEEPEEDSIDLPDILARIRSDAAARDNDVPAIDLRAGEQRDEPNELPRGPEVDSATTPEPVDATEPEPAAEAVPAAVAVLEAEPGPVLPAAPQAELPAAQEPPPAAPAPRQPIPTVAASSHVNTDAAERAKRLEDDRKRLAEQALLLDAEEATVTFVIREPVERNDGDGATMHRHAPARPSHFAPRRESAEGFTPPSSDADEAEVVIVSSKTTPAKGRQPGSVRRFLKSLTGN
jgi:predicted flap endonuclease-1-like 5' DNA nuclease